MEKVKELLASRRLWAAVAGCVMAAVCYKQGLIAADKMVAWIETSWEVYAGSLGLEHVAKVLQEGKGKLVDNAMPKPDSENKSLEVADTDPPPPDKDPES